MFGGFPFAAAAFGGQLLVGGAGLSASATISVGTTAGLTLGPVLAADATIQIGVSAKLKGPHGVLFLINGSGASRVLFPALRIHDVLGAQPNTADLTFLTDVPTGAAVQIGYNSFAPADLLFSGLVQAETRKYDSKPAITSYPGALIDQTFLANRRRPFGAYVNVSATTIAQQLIGTYAPDFSAAGVQ